MDIGAFFEMLGTSATGVAGVFGKVFSGIIPVFWNVAESGPGTPTILTILIGAGVAFTLGFWAIDKLIAAAKMGLGGLSKGRAKRSKRGA